MISAAALRFDGLPRMDEAAPPQAPSARAGAVSADVDSTVELVTRARAGDSAAFEDLVARYQSRLQGWAHGRLPYFARGALDTHDLVQITLVRVLKKLPEFQPRHAGAFRDYVWTTLWNEIRDLVRKHRRHGPSEPLDHEMPSDAPSPLEQAIGSEVLDRYERALERMRPDDREAIVARIEMGLPYPDVAAFLGKPSIDAAHRAVSRALVRLAEEMAHERKRTVVR
jgi:RNA polymerase sigma factor (sigma-70 family)